MSDTVRRVASIIGVILVGLAAVAVVIVTIGPRLLPYQTDAVRSDDMAPALERGTLVFLVRTDAEDIDVGDIITVDLPAPRGLVNHRVVGIDGEDEQRSFVTQGDANPQPDPFPVAGTGEGWRYRFGVPIVGYVLGSRAAQVLLIVVPALLIGAWALLDRQPSRRRPRPLHYDR